MSAFSLYSPDGRVFQIEYAAKAVDNSGTVVGIKCMDGVAIGVEKLITYKMMFPGSNRRIHSIHSQSGTVTISGQREVALLTHHKFQHCFFYGSTYGEGIPVKELPGRVANYVHLRTLYWWPRVGYLVALPFGCGVILGGYDRDGPCWAFPASRHCHLYKYIPLVLTLSLCIISLNREIKKLNLSEMTCREGVIEVAKMYVFGPLLFSLHDQAKDKAFELEMIWVRDQSWQTGPRVPEELLEEEAKAAARLALEEIDADFQSEHVIRDSSGIVRYSCCICSPGESRESELNDGTVSVGSLSSESCCGKNAFFNIFGPGIRRPDRN
ncbi:hypothetical protein MLD38_017199 [Melastoma candidum]|uniref:Uncharacterized protein n=1 Tax=Melastoma candidum TaxID=119954 RepID=A0ACB9QRR1_9MYRT|nr:hypothetical protein MLD38_017199 [Melastoma candidum]